MALKIEKTTEDYIVAMRRHFHQNPEPSLKEKETQEKIMAELELLGIAFKPIATTGVIGTIEGQCKGKTVALRADIDALEITELTEVSYKSKTKGLMHACGHDGHTAMLLGAAKVLSENRDQLNGTVKLLFQPAEELLKGAKKMVEEGALDSVDAIYGQHLWNDIPCGLVNVEPGPRMASGDPVTVKFTGKGGHGSMPNQTIDPIVVASSFIMNANSILSREKSPMSSMVLTFGKMKSGTRFNIIPETAELEGSLRCFSEEDRTRAHEAIKRYADATAMMYGATAETIIEFGTPATINDESVSKLANTVAKAVVGNEQVISLQKTTGSEDMAYYFQEVPGAFGMIGAGFKDKEVFPHHHPKFDFDEKALKIGSEMYINFAIEYLK